MSGSASEGMSKFQVALISAVCSIVTALTTSFFSYRAASEQLALKDTVERVDVFTRLIEKIENQKGANYALLALWKVYPDPEDRKLIVITALQDPQPSTIAILKALGYGEDLAELKPTIRTLLESTDGVQRKKIEDLLLEIDPSEAFDLAVDRLLSTPDANFRSAQFDAVYRLLNREELRARLLTHYEKDSRINGSPSARFRVAYALYLQDERDPFDKLLAELEVNPQTEVAPLASMLKDISFSRIELSDARRLSRLAIDYIKSAMKDKDTERRELAIGDGLDILQRALAVQGPVDVATSERAATVLADAFENGTSYNSTRDSILNQLIKVSGEAGNEHARKLYFSVIACEPEDNNYFLMSDKTALYCEPSDICKDFSEAQVLAKKNLQKESGYCNNWMEKNDV